MSRWLVICCYCDWSCTTDDLDDGSAQADKHGDVCDAPVSTPFADVGGHQ